ncbi:MAG: threonine synthase [Clostridia bacterium]|nr:threonine synthase [Clostridia bacterium]
MKYTSTRDGSICVESAQAIAQGISAEGGLFVPQQMPQLTMADLTEIAAMDYVEAAKKVLGYFLTDYTPDEIDHCAKGAYVGSFDQDRPAPLVKINDHAYSLELWHGPTCAFKDLALQILPYLLTKAAQKTADGETKVILVATSGDTGKAALEGFADVDGVKILVFYPSDGVSAMQKLQMTTQKGNNVGVCAVHGNFDDCQTGVKQIFTDSQKAAALKAGNMAFSSANSINWGRLVPQIIYYIYSYASLLGQGVITQGETVNVVVPTGNFGNILAAYYAKQMGVPLGKLICASNQNNILTDFIRTGTYDRNRDFYTTLSPSMDILISSNLERLLYHLTDGNAQQVKCWMEDLSKNGKYTVDDATKAKITDLFYGGCADDTATKAAIARQFDRNGYLADPHTGVALQVYENYVDQTDDHAVTVIASTASPFKFSKGVLEAIGRQTEGKDEFTLCEELSAATGYAIPASIAALRGATPRFTDICEKQELWQQVVAMLGL